MPARHLTVAGSHQPQRRWGRRHRRKLVPAQGGRLREAQRILAVTRSRRPSQPAFTTIRAPTVSSRFMDTLPPPRLSQLLFPTLIGRRNIIFSMVSLCNAAAR